MGAEPDREGAWVWHVRGLVIAVTWTPGDEPQPKRLLARVDGKTTPGVDRDLATWSRKGVRCAKNDLVLRGVGDAVIVFSQGVGPTLHDCDGVPVPTAYRVVPYVRQ